MLKSPPTPPAPHSRVRLLAIAGCFVMTATAFAQVDFGRIKYEKLPTRRETEQRMLALIANTAPVE